MVTIPTILYFCGEARDYITKAFAALPPDNRTRESLHIIEELLTFEIDDLRHEYDTNHPLPPAA